MMIEDLPTESQAMLRALAGLLKPMTWPDRYRIVCHVMRESMPGALAATGGHKGLARELVGVRIGALLELLPGGEEPTCEEHALLLGMSASVAHVDAGRLWFAARPEEAAMVEAAGATLH